MPSSQAGPVSEAENPSERHHRRAAQGVATDSFHVDLRQYEGPLDALLDLIKRQQLDVLDIPIAKVTEQYLESIRRAEALNIEISAEFLMMAATLIHIKSKALLPTTPGVEEDEGDDPREDLVRSLLEREQFLDAAQMLEARRVVEESVWTVGARETEPDGDDESERLDVTLFDLVKTFSEVLERLRNEPTVEMDPETVSVASRIRYLRGLLEVSEGPVPVRRVLLNQRTVRAIVATFLALLEMVKGQAIELSQQETFGEIFIERHALYEQAFQGGEFVRASESELGQLA